jgi:hypothetical protein
VARLVAIRQPVSKRISGRVRDLFSVPEDFDAPLTDSILSEFES